MVLGGIVVALSCPDAVRAGSALAPIEEFLLESDRLHDEYNQDLSVDVRELRARFGNQEGFCLLAEARLRRLRGEYKTAQLLLTAAKRAIGENPLAQIYVSQEEIWTRIDRLSSPWNSVRWIAPDVLCQSPRVENLIFDLFDAHSDALLGSLPGGLRLTAENSKLFREQVGWLMQAGAQLGQRDRFAATTDQMILSNAKSRMDFVDSVGKTARSSRDEKNLSATQIDRMYFRIALPLLALEGRQKEIEELAACQQRATAREPQMALICAEVALFPDGFADNLGHLVETPLVAEVLFSVASGHALSLKGIKLPDAAVVAKAMGWLDVAGRGFAEARNLRGQARVEYIRGAAALARALAVGSAAPPIGDRLDAAAGLALRAGDLRLQEKVQILRAMTLALRGDRDAALLVNQTVVDAVRSEEAFGAALGFAELAASVAATQAFARFDPSSASTLNEMSMRLYAAVGASVERGMLARRQAQTLKATGMLLAAERVLKDGLGALKSSCADPVSQATTTAVRYFLAGDLQLIHSDLDDVDSVKKDVENLHKSLRELGGGEDDLKVLQQGVTKGIDELIQIQSDFPAFAARLMFSLFQGNTMPTTAKGERALRSALEIVKRGQAVLARTTNLTTAASIAGVLPTLRMRVALDDGWDQIFDDPDLPLVQRYQTASALAQAAVPPYQPIMQTMLYRAREDFGSARQLWQRLAEQSQDPWIEALAPVKDPRVLNEDTKKRMKIDRFMTRAGMFLGIEAFGEARESFAQVEALMNSSTWYAWTQEPWKHMSGYVQILSGLSRHAEALALSRKMLSEIEARRTTFYDERFRFSFLDSMGSNSSYAVAVQAAVAAGLAPDAVAFMEQGKARGLQDLLAEEANPRWHRLRELAQAAMLAEYLWRDCMAVVGRGCSTEESTFHERQRLYDAQWKKSNLSQAEQKVTAADVRLAARIADHLPSDTVLVNYFITSQRSMAVVVATAERPPSVVLRSFRSGELSGRARRLSTALIRRLGPGKEWDVAQHDAQELSKALLDFPELRRAIDQPEIKRIVIVPHGFLHRVPFAFLPFDGKHLVQRFSVQLLPFASQVLNPPVAHGKAPVSDFQAFVHVGDAENGRPLSATVLGEAEKIAKQYRRSPAAQADRNAILSALSKSEIVHIVGHGIVTATGGPIKIDLPRRSAQDDGDLSLSDIMAWEAQLRSKVVVLSACGLASGKISAGDESYGIARALLQKGVKTVVGNLLPFPDSRVVTQLLLDLHARLRVGMPAGAALQEVQLDAIRNHVHPGYWAGFVALGW